MRTSLICIYFIVLTSALAQLPEQYAKKNYVEFSSETFGEKYHFTYSFRDEKNQLKKWQWWVPVNDNDYSSDLFGIPLDRIQGDRIKVVSHDMRYFIQEGGVLRPDYIGLLNIYRPLALPLYRLYKEHVEKNNLSGRLKIEFLLRFLQDYPYGIVPPNYRDKYINGLLPLSEVFKTGWADCDSKSLVMATILSYDPDFKERLAMIAVPGHALLGIEGVPRPYEKYVQYLGKKYIYAEPVGSLRTAFGRTNSPYTRSIQVYPLEVFDFDEPVNVEVEVSQSTEKSSGLKLNDSDCPEGAFLLKYDLPGGTRKQLCAVSRGGEIINHGPEIILESSGKLKSKAIYDMGKKRL